MMRDQTKLKEELGAATVATDEQVQKLAEACNARLLEMADVDAKGVWAPWFTLFKSIDCYGRRRRHPRPQSGGILCSRVFISRVAAHSLLLLAENGEGVALVFLL